MNPFHPIHAEESLNCVLKALHALANVLWQLARYRIQSMFAARVLFARLIVLILCRPAWSQSQTSPNCELRATPPPMATLGGAATAAPGSTELGIAVGVFGEGFDSPCDIDMVGASDWLGRWRRGLTSRTDIGFDLLIAEQGNLAGTVKAAMRYQATKGLRLEGGAGFSDGGTGRSVNGDLAAVIGTYKHPDNTWNYYASIRLGASHGCNNLLCVGSPGRREATRRARLSHSAS